MIPSKVKWYTAYTLPKFEKKVSAELSKRNIEAYLPLQKVVRQWSDRVKKIEVPLFPNYIFIKTTELNRREAISVRGICKFVSFDGRPAVIADEDISAIKKLSNENPEVEANLIEGSNVRIMRGPLAGLTGVLYSKKGKNRFGLRIETIKQTLSLEVPVSFLEEITSATFNEFRDTHSENYNSHCRMGDIVYS
jgi:transcription antitermination factor NusG